MKLKSSFLGTVSVHSTQIFNFFQGLIGKKEYKKFALLEKPEDELLFVLQSFDDENHSLRLIETETFLDSYKVDLNSRDKELLSISPQNIKVYCIVNDSHEKVENYTVNLKAPIIINIYTKEAKQCVLENEYSYSYPFYNDLKARYKKTVSSNKSSFLEI